MLRIAVTGAPCAGKSGLMKVLSKLNESIESLKIVTVPEVYTLLEDMGIRPRLLGKEAWLETCFNYQKMMEDSIVRYVEEKAPDTKAVIFDRGFGDLMYFMGKEHYYHYATEHPIGALSSRYDKVVHMMSVSSYQETHHLYHWRGNPLPDGSTNMHRFETPDEASEQDTGLVKLWRSEMDLHDIHYISPSLDYKEKISHALSIVAALIKAPELMERRIKWNELL